MAQYSKKDIIDYVSNLLEIWGRIDLDAMTIDLEASGGSITKAELDQSRKRREDSLNILGIVLQIVDAEVPGDAMFEGIEGKAEKDGKCQ